MTTVKEATYVEGYTIRCKFNDGTTKLVDLSVLLQYPAFQELKDIEQFRQFGLDDTLFWNNGADIAPEFLYEHGVVA